MSAPRGRRSGAIAFLISVTLVVTGSMSAPVVHAAGNGPSVRLIAGTDKVTLKRPPGRGAYLDIGAYVASIGGAFEIWASRPDYDTPVSVWQVVRSGSSITKYPLPSWVDNDWMGLSRFIHVVVTDADGMTVLDRYHSFCPGAGELARVSDDGPDVATYPQFCGGNPFTLGSVWGIDSGWASSAFGYGTNDTIKGPDGHYTATVSINPDYQDLLGIAPADATISVDVRVKTTKGNTCLPFCEGMGRSGRAGARGRVRRHAVGIGADHDEPRPQHPSRPDRAPRMGHLDQPSAPRQPRLPGLRRDRLEPRAVAPGRRGIPPSRRAGDGRLGVLLRQRRTGRPCVGRRPDVRRSPRSPALALRAVRAVLVARRAIRPRSSGARRRRSAWRPRTRST